MFPVTEQSPNTPRMHMVIMDEYRQQLTAVIAALKQAGESL